MVFATDSLHPKSSHALVFFLCRVVVSNQFMGMGSGDGPVSRREHKDHANDTNKKSCSPFTVPALSTSSATMSTLRAMIEA